jgi:hypothetical protein
MRLARRPHIRPLHISQVPRTLAPDSIENFAQGTHVAGLHAFARAIGLCVGRRGGNGTQKKSNQDGRKIPHGAQLLRPSA